MALIIDRQHASISVASIATTRLLTTQAIGTGQIGFIYAKAVMKMTSTVEGGGYERVAVFKNVAGTLSQVSVFSVGASPTDDLKIFETDIPSGWSFSFTVNGTAVDVNVVTTTTTAVTIEVEVESRITY